jgi:hypothetical protein
VTKSFAVDRGAPAYSLVIARHIDKNLQGSHEFRRYRIVTGTGTGIGDKALVVGIAGE